MERLINQVKSCLPHSRILLVSPIHLGKGVWEQDYDPEFSEASVEVSKKLAGVYSEIAEKESIDFFISLRCKQAKRNRQGTLKRTGT